MIPKEPVAENLAHLSVTSSTSIYIKKKKEEHVQVKEKRKSGRTRILKKDPRDASGPVDPATVQ